MPGHKVAIPRAVAICLPNAEGELEMRKVPLQDWSHSVAHSNGREFWGVGKKIIGRMVPKMRPLEYRIPRGRIGMYDRQPEQGLVPKRSSV